MAFAKRKRVYAPRRNGFKKRRTMRRRKAPRQSNGTSLQTKGYGIQYRGKKTSRRVYAKHLWDSTLFKQHWRSLSSTSFNIVTTASNVTGTLTGINLWKNAGTSFFTAAGGTVLADTGAVVPTFIGDIILRGGRTEVTFYNSSATGDVRIKVFLLNTVTDPGFSIEPVSPPIGWDSTVSPDFAQQIGKTWMMKEVVIEQGNSWTYQMRHKLCKIDQLTYSIEGKSPLMYALLSNVGHIVPTTVVITKSYNLSFSGDGT